MLNLRVKSINYEAVDINSYELVDPAGGELPEFSAGSHIDVHIKGKFIRQYSLCNDPRDRSRYVFAVLNVKDGRGGSSAIHATVKAGDILKVSEPRNNFCLCRDAKKHLMIAGGIGITPLLSMLEDLSSCESPFELHYCCRSPERAAFRDRIVELGERGEVHFHFDNGNAGQGLRLDELLWEPPADTHLYYCGPGGLMKAIGEASSAWPKESVHCEHFVPPPSVAPMVAGSFNVKIASSGLTLPVPPELSIAEVLKMAGIECETSCEAGLCGTCRTRYLEGEPDHADFVLDDAEREHYLTVCCSRAKSEMLVLDL